MAKSKDAKGAAAAAAQPSRRRPRIVVWVLACLVLVGGAAAIVVSSRGGGQSKLALAIAKQCAAIGGKAGYRTAMCPNRKTFDPAYFVQHGDEYDCSWFARQADAQAVLKADPSDPNHLDDDRDGIACAQLGAPKDLTPVASIAAAFTCDRHSPRTGRCPQPWRHFDALSYTRFGAGDAFDCAQFASQADAQAVLLAQPSDPNKLDPDGRGIACPQLRGPKNLTPAPTPRSSS
jgi:hypothetical protein